MCRNDLLGLCWTCFFGCICIVTIAVCLYKYEKQQLYLEKGYEQRIVECRSKLVTDATPVFRKVWVKVDMKLEDEDD